MPILRVSLAILPLCLLAACTTGSPSFNETSYGINRQPNTAPRGSDEFCRIYAAQTTANRIESSNGPGGRGTSGFDRFLAGNEGARAYERCRSGRTG